MLPATATPHPGLLLFLRARLNMGLSASSSLRGGDFVPRTQSELKRMERETALLIGAVAQDGAARQALVAKSGKTGDEVSADAASMLQVMREMGEMKDMMRALLAAQHGGGGAVAADTTALEGAIGAMSRKMDKTAAEVKLIGADVRHGFGYTTWSDLFTKRTLGLILKSPLLMAGKALQLYLAPQNAVIQYLSKPLLLALGAVQLAVHVIALAYGASYLFAAFPALGQLATDALGHVGGLLQWLDGVYGSVLSAAGADFYRWITELLLRFKDAAVAKVTDMLAPLLDSIITALKQHVTDLVGAAGRGALSAATFGYFGGGGYYFGIIGGGGAGAYEREERILRSIPPQLSEADAVRAWLQAR